MGREANSAQSCDEGIVAITEAALPRCTLIYREIVILGISVETGPGHPGHIFSGSDPVYRLSGSDPDWIT